MKRRLKKLLLIAAYGLVIGLPVIVVGFITTVEIAISAATLPDDLDAELVGTPTYLDRSGKVFAQLATDEARMHLPVQLEDMGEWLPAATIALEDHRFEQHLGVDWYAIAAATARNIRHPSKISGASTISQQLIKQADRRTGRRLKAKVREAILALKLERSWEKREILAAYLNRLDYGNRRFGPESAAIAYFGKGAKQLTEPEAIYLAGLPQSPSRYNPWKHPERALAKYRRSLQRLHTLGILDGQQLATWAENPPVTLRESPANNSPMFLQAALAESGASPGTHTTTLDLRMQMTAEQMLRGQLDSINRHDVRNAAIVVIENESGAVRALASVARSESDGESEINGGLIPRHAGSTLKPFVYLMGIDEKKFTAATVFSDTQDAVARRYADYDPHNFSRGYRGPVRLREALANSMNIPAVLALDQVGARRCFFALEDWSLRGDNRFEEIGAGFVLGNLRVRLLDLTSAYSALARGGLAARPQFSADAPPSPQRRIAAPEAARIIEDILCDNRARAHAFGSDSPLNLGWRAAAKTGTSSSFRDAWTVGYCRDFTVGVWVGNYNGQSMTGTLAVQSATPIWRRMMLHLKNRYDARPLPPLEPSSKLAQSEICSISGLLPSALSPVRQQEWFLVGTAPKENADNWFAARGTSADGSRFGVLPPLLPDSYAFWVASRHNHLGASLQPPDDGGGVLKILSPRDGLTYAIDQDLPAAQQALELRALAGNGEDEIEWSVNGEPLSKSHWQLRRGEWQFVARSPSGSEAEVKISVE